MSHSFPHMHRHPAHLVFTFSIIHWISNKLIAHASIKAAQHTLTNATKIYDNGSGVCITTDPWAIVLHGLSSGHLAGERYADN